MPSNEPREELFPDASGLQQTPKPTGSRRPAKGCEKAASTARTSSESSPPSHTRSGQAPDQPPARCSLAQFPTQDGGTSPHEASNCPEAFEEMDLEIETPTRRPTGRVRPKSTERPKTGGLSPLRQAMAPGTDVSSTRSEHATVRPALGSSNTSPEVMERARRRSLRPNITERGVSEPVTPVKKLSGFQLDANIAQLIKRGPKTTNGKDKENGTIYFYKVKPRGSEIRLVKIGRTQKDADKRLSQISRVCGHREIEEHTKAIARDVPFHGFAERLIHTELNNYQHQWICECGKRHREYFLVSEDIAVKVFERWRDFCNEKPWDSDGKLLPKWVQRLQARAKFDGEEWEFDHHEFGRRWTAFTAPISFERFLSDAIHVWKLGYPNRWLIISLAELLTIICISRHSLWSSTWTTIIVVLILADLVVTENMYTTSDIFRLMEGGLQSSTPHKKPTEDTATAEPEDPATGNSQDEARHRPNSERTAAERRERYIPAFHQGQIDTRKALAGDNKSVSQKFTDDEINEMEKLVCLRAKGEQPMPSGT